MATIKWGFTDDMAFILIGGSTVSAILGARIRITRDDKEQHTCGTNEPWRILPGKKHYAIEYDGIMLDKATYYDRFQGATNAFSGGVYYPAFATIAAKAQNPYVGASTVHYKQYEFGGCLINEPNWEFANGDGIIIQKSVAMCSSLTVTEQDPAD